MLGKLKTFNVPANFWIIIGTLTVLVLFYIFYFEYHIASRESEIVSTRFRVLDQMGNNIQDKLKSYQTNANQIGSKILLDAEKEANDPNSKYYKGRGLPNEEEIYNKILYEIIYGGNTDILTDYLNRDLELVGVEERSNKETDKYFYFDAVPLTTSDFYVTDTLNVHVRTTYSNLLKGLHRDDVFDGFFILKDSEIVYSTLESDLMLGTVPNAIASLSANQEDSQIKELLYHDEILIPTKKEAVVGHIYSGEFMDITISNEKYKLFFKPVKVDGKDWFLCGLMDTSNFNAAKRSISPGIIVFLSLILVLIVLGLPLIKLKVISKIEHLDTQTITNSALSILLGSSALTLFILFITQSAINLQKTDNRLQNFSNEIYHSLTGEIDEAFQQLQFYDSKHDNFNFDDKNKFQFGPIVTNILNHPKDSIGKPLKYKFADYLFWINSDGIQSAYLTPFDEIGTLSNLKKRDYFNKKDEWFLPYPLDSTKKFRLESIVSVTSGSRKVAMSTNSRVKNNPVIAVSSKFYSLIDPIVPRNYGFCIVDKSGKVWFHSNKNRNLMENFINECNGNKLMKAAIYSRTSKSINVNYYNKPHRIFIKPIDKMPLYLVTFYNKSADTSFHAQVFTLTLISLGSFFLFLFIQVIILMVMERQLQWKLSKNLIMKITRPMIHLKNHYKFLVWAYVFVGLISAILLSRVGRLQSFVVIFSMEIILFTFSFRVLNHNQVKVRRRKWFTIINMIILFLIDIFFLPKLSVKDAIVVLAYQVILIVLLELAYKRRKVKLEDYSTSLDSSFIRVYVFFLIAIALNFTVLPTLKFYEIGYNIESEIRMRHKQIDLMKKRESRNMDWNKYYNNQVKQSDTTIAILNERKNKGIYTTFLDNIHFSSKPTPIETYTSKKPSIFDSLVVVLRPVYDNEVVENKYLINSGQNSNNINWLSSKNDTLALKYLSQTEDSKSQELLYHGLFANINSLNFLYPFEFVDFSHFKKAIYGLFFWAVILFILYLIYFLIQFGIRSIYSLNIVQYYSHEPFAEIIRQQMLANKDVMIVRLSVKDETTALIEGLRKDITLDWSDEETIKNSEAIINKGLKNKIKTLKSQNTENNDFKELKTTESFSNTFTVFIDHFEWHFDNPTIFKKKLEVLWEFINRKDLHFIIVSQIHPEKMLESYMGNFEDADSNFNGSDSKETAASEPGKILTELRQFMNNFIINYLPARFNYSWKDEDKYCIRGKSKMSFTELIDSELEASDYLVQFKDALNKYYETSCIGRKIDNPEELIITKINSLADNYYEDIFNACSNEEKYVLFDLADDLIMNQKNSNAIYGLLKKGILIKKCDKINFMNVSFRRFLMNKLSDEGTSALEIKMGKEEGTWQGYKFTLIIIIVALFAFIAMANQDFLDNLNQLFIAIGGGIAVITGILGLLSRKNTDSS